MNKICLALFWGATLSCLAQDPPQIIPPGNPTQFPPGDAAWTVDISYPHAGQGATSNAVPAYTLVKIEVTQVGDVRRNVIHWGDGKVSERWHFPGYTVIQTPATGVAVYSDGSRVLAEVIRSLGYDAGCFGWIAPAFYQDVALYAKKECYHYKGMVKGTNRDPVTPSPPSLHEAWIDRKTLLPMAVDDGFSLAVFTFSAAPTGPLTPPPAIASALDRYRRLLTPLKATKFPP